MVEEDNDGNGDGHEDDRRGPPTTRARCQARRSRRRAATCGGRVGKTQTGSLCRREPRVRERERTSANERASEEGRRERARRRERERDEGTKRVSLSVSLSSYRRTSSKISLLTCLSSVRHRPSRSGASTDREYHTSF